jgi:hypothetical protein
VLEVLENEIDLSFLLEGLLDTHYIVTFQHFEHFDLTLDGFATELVFVGFLEFFDCDSLCQ